MKDEKIFDKLHEELGGKIVESCYLLDDALIEAVESPESGIELHINIMSSNADETIDSIRSVLGDLHKREIALKAKGHHGNFGQYDERSFEIVYSIHVDNPEDVEKIVKDFCQKDSREEKKQNECYQGEIIMAFTEQLRDPSANYLSNDEVGDIGQHILKCSRCMYQVFESETLLNLADNVEKEMALMNPKEREDITKRIVEGVQRKRELYEQGK